MHLIELAFALVLAMAGRSMEARMAMIAITTNSSMSVNAALLSPEPQRGFEVFFMVV
jgi:hypothetical protein